MSCISVVKIRDSAQMTVLVDDTKKYDSHLQRRCMTWRTDIVRRRIRTHHRKRDRGWRRSDMAAESERGRAVGRSIRWSVTISPSTSCCRDSAFLGITEIRSDPAWSRHKFRCAFVNFVVFRDWLTLVENVSTVRHSSLGSLARHCRDVDIRLFANHRSLGPRLLRPFGKGRRSLSSCRASRRYWHVIDYLITKSRSEIESQPFSMSCRKD